MQHCKNIQLAISDSTGWFPFGFASPVAASFPKLFWLISSTRGTKVCNDSFDRIKSQEMSSCIKMDVLTRTLAAVNSSTCYFWLICQTEVNEIKNWYIWVGCHFFFPSLGWCIFMLASLCYCLTLPTGNIYSLVIGIKQLWKMDCSVLKYGHLL